MVKLIDTILDSKKGIGLFLGGVLMGNWQQCFASRIRCVKTQRT